MATRNILRGDDPSLKKSSRVVTDFNKRLHILLDDMRETLLEANGLGLAAPQVGVLRRAVLVVDTTIETEDPGEQIIELINPEIIARSGEQTGNEGCLSIPGVYGIVTRPQLVRVKAQDRFGAAFEVWGQELKARALCHEIDHLNGVMFTEYTDQLLTEEELEKLEAEKAEKAEKADTADSTDTAEKADTAVLKDTAESAGMSDSTDTAKTAGTGPPVGNSQV